MADSSQPKAPAIPNWTGLEDFDIEVDSGSSRLYRNGRQQVRVLAIITALDTDSNTVPLTEEEKKSLRLVRYNGSGDLPAGWTVKRDHDGYDYYPEFVGRDRTRERRSGTEYIELYVSTTTTDTSPLKLALEITRDDGVIIRSNKTDTDPDDSFNEESSVALDPEPVPTSTINDYAIVRRRVEGSSGDWETTFIDNHYIGAKSGGAISFRDMSVDPAGMIQWHDKAVGETFASYTGFGAPGSSEARYNTAIVLGGHVPRPDVKQAETGRGVIMLVARPDIPYHSESAVEHKGPCRITLIDNYGNEHRLTVDFKDESPQGRLELTFDV